MKRTKLFSIFLSLALLAGANARADVTCDVVNAPSGRQDKKVSVIFVNFYVGAYGGEPGENTLIAGFDYDDYSTYRYAFFSDSEQVGFNLFQTGLLMDLRVQRSSRRGTLEIPGVGVFQLTGCRGSIP